MGADFPVAVDDEQAGQFNQHSGGDCAKQIGGLPDHRDKPRSGDTENGEQIGFYSLFAVVDVKIGDFPLA